MHKKMKEIKHDHRIKELLHNRNLSEFWKNFNYATKQIFKKYAKKNRVSWKKRYKNLLKNIFINQRNKINIEDSFMCFEMVNTKHFGIKA